MMEAKMSCDNCGHEVVIQARNSMIAVDDACREFFLETRDVRACQHPSGVVQTRDVKKGKVLTTIPWSL